MLFTCMHINSAWTISDVWCFPCYLLYTLLSVGHSIWHVQMAQVKWGKRNSNPGSSSWNNRVVPLIHDTFSNYKILEKLKWKKFSPKLVGSKVLSFPITRLLSFYSVGNVTKINYWGKKLLHSSKTWCLQTCWSVLMTAQVG